MKVRKLHDWDLSRDEAFALQRRLSGQVDISQPLGRCEVIAGVDVSYNRFSDLIFAGVVVWRVADRVVIERKSAMVETHFSYFPGLLSFREAPVLLAALAKVKSLVDVVLIDGHGFAHPRRMGIASHIGLCIDTPCVGCAKSKLYGKYVEPAWGRGSTTPLMARNETIGEVVRSKNGVKPLFVSPGNRLDIAGTTRVVLNSLGGYRVPEPTRLAHQFVNEIRRRAAVKTDA